MIWWSWWTRIRAMHWLRQAVEKRLREELAKLAS